MIADIAPSWPKKYDVLGVGISATTYAETVELIINAARRQVPAVVAHYSVHPVVEARFDADLRRKVNSFAIVAPDGQPVRWALNLLHKAGLRDRVYGPELMMRLCRQAAQDGIGIYLYGSMPPVIDALCEKLRACCPNLRIDGAESPPFRPLTDQERAAMIERINASGAGIVFIGLGSPKQDHFAYDHQGEIRAVQVCVGAAFDFHAGNKRMAPRWMQRNGLEWLFRLCAEPGRLWRRYLVNNSLFIVMLAALWFGRIGGRRRARAQ